MTATVSDHDGPAGRAAGQLEPAEPRAQAERLRGEVTERLADEARAAALLLGNVYVGWTAAVDVAACPARYRALGQAGWLFPGWSPTLAAGAVGRSALLHHLWVHHRPGPELTEGAIPPLPDPVGTVRAWMKATIRGEIRTPVGEWIAQLDAAADRGGLAATAASASRWLAGFVRVLGWPLPDRLGIVADDLDNPIGLRWQKKFRPGADAPGVIVASSPDAVLGPVTPTGDHTLVVHRPSSRTDTALADRAAFETVAAALTTGVVPRAVTFTAGDTGEKVHIEADDGLLDRGAASIVEVIHQRRLASAPPDPTGVDGTDSTDTTDARPSPDCRYCDCLDRCSPGQTWMAGPGRWHAGLPTLSLEPTPESTAPHQHQS